MGFLILTPPKLFVEFVKIYAARKPRDFKKIERKVVGRPLSAAVDRYKAPGSAKNKNTFPHAANLASSVQDTPTLLLPSEFCAWLVHERAPAADRCALRSSPNNQKKLSTIYYT